MKEKYSHMGKIVTSAQVIYPGFDQKRARNIVWLLAVSMALMMTGFGAIFPIFAQRLGELGSGVEALGTMAMTYSLAGIIASPVMGALADRYGRRPMVLGSLAAFALSNIGFLFATNTEMLIVIRTLEGALSAGLFPAAMGVVGDIAPEHKRARWIGYVMGGFSLGWVFGPAAGGLLYDLWGYSAPFLASAFVAFLALIAAVLMIPETRNAKHRLKEKLLRQRADALVKRRKVSLLDSIPRPLSSFVVLIFIAFISMFTWAFIEPPLMFYVFDDLGWTTTQFGLMAGGYGISAAVGSAALGQLSDKWGRKLILIIGMILYTAQYMGMAVTILPSLIFVTFFIAGLGEALFTTSLNTFTIDIALEQHRARVMGIKSAAISLGGVLGPLLVIYTNDLTSPQNLFLLSGVIMIFSVVLAVLVLKEPDKITKDQKNLPQVEAQKRDLAADAALREAINHAKAYRQWRKAS